MFCEQCGTKNLDTSKFCESCGALLVTYPMQSESRQVLRPVPAVVYSPSEYTSRRHRGYSRIIAWIKQKYPTSITDISDPNLMKSELEIMGNQKLRFPEKTWTGLLEYLKKQNREQLLK